MNDEAKIKWMEAKTNFIQRTFKRFLHVLTPIVEILDKLIYDDWRQCGFSEKEIIENINIWDQLNEVFDENLDKTDVEEPFYLNIIDSLQQLIRFYQESLGEDCVNKELDNIIKVEKNPHIAKILTFTSPKYTSCNISSTIRVRLLIIYDWLEFRIGLLQNAKQAYKSNGNIAEVDRIMERFENLPLSPDSQKDQLERRGWFATLLAWSVEQGPNPIIIVLQSIEKAIQDMLLKHKSELFKICNNIFIPLGVRKKIVDIINKSAYHDLLQKEYEIYRSYILQLLPWKFSTSRKYNTNIILPNDFNTGERIPKLSMNLDLERQQVITLYHNLRGKYIDNRTDILDFAFSLTGYPVERGKVFNKIVWVHPHKQTLGMFLGMLCPEGKRTKMGKYWKVASNLFCYQSRENILKPGQLSSPYNNQLKHSELRKEDWTELESIIDTYVKKHKK